MNVNENQKKKLATIKQKIKAVAPAAIAFTAAAASVVLTLNAINTASKNSKHVDDIELTPFPEVTGSEKETLLERTDTVIQYVEPGFYFLSVTPQETQPES